jgi:hypothetical protein
MKYSLKNNYFKWLVLGLGILFSGFVIVLFGFLFMKTKILKESNIPSLDKVSLEKIITLEESRPDVDTEGKPDITKFNYGNEEPFR